MKATPLTIDDVRQAIQILRAEGVPDPGVHRIRAYLGRGSVTTINNFKHAIRLQLQSSVMPGSDKPIPDPVTEMVTKVWSSMIHEVDLIEKQREDEISRELVDLKKRFDELTKDNAHLRRAIREKATLPRI